MTDDARADAAPGPSPRVQARAGEVAVIFVSRRAAAAGPDDGYAEAATLLEELAGRQPGYRGHAGAREGDEGVTVSYWADDAAARAWRDHPEHVRLRAAGRAHWYDGYETVIARVERDYRWTRGPEAA